ncbi:MAG: hypothetical protein J1F66_02770 [Clostridiales bacterium]|nr:hypothetical protein [Clostridiales bacterium]
MPEQIQDEIINFEDFNEYNISYPVIITRWEIKQVRSLNKQYLQVYFQKISDTVKAFKFNVKCYSAFGEVVEDIADVSIQEVNKKNTQFSEIVPLKTEIRKVEINLKQCLLLDDSVVEPKGRQIAINNFKLFDEENAEAGKRLLPSAKGFPVDNLSHWYCACGALHSAEMQECGNCHKSKQEIFTLVTAEKIQEEKLTIAEIERKNNQKKKIHSLVLTCITFATIIITLIPTVIYVIIAPSYSVQPEFRPLMISLLTINVVLLVVYLIGFILKLKAFPMIELITALTCLIIDVIRIVIAGVDSMGLYRWYDSNYGGYIRFGFLLSIITILFAIGYFVMYVLSNNKLLDKLRKLFEFKRNKK